MGFPEFWSLLEQPDVFFPTGGLEARDLTTTERKYLLVDFNNIRNDLLDSGNVVTNYTQTNAFWLAIARSGYHVIIVRDGFHDADRAVIKLKRMLSSLAESLNSTAVQADTFSDLKLSSTCGIASGDAFKMVKTEFGDSGRFEFHTATEEADPFIRNKARKLISGGNTVVIMSGDASVVTGVPSACQVFPPKHCRLQYSGNGSVPVLSGYLFRVQDMLDAINAYISRTCTAFRPSRNYQSPSACLDSTGLCVVAAILGGERSDNTLDEDKRPINLSYYVQNHLYNTDKHSKRTPMDPRHPLCDRKARSLVCVAILVILWQQSPSVNYECIGQLDCPNPASLFDKLIVLVREVAGCTSQVKKEYWARPSVFGLICENRGSKMYIDAGAVKDMLQTRLNEIMDIDSQIEEGAEAQAGPVLLYKGSWGLWTSSREPLELNTERVLEPLSSLSYQFSKLHKLREPTVLPGGEEITFDNTVDFADWFGSVTSATWVPPGATVRYWKSFKPVNSMELDQFTSFTESSLFAYVMQHGRLPSRGKLQTVPPRFEGGRPYCPGVVAWDVRKKRQFVQDFDRLSKISFRSNGGPLLDMSERVKLLKSYASKTFEGSLVLAGVSVSVESVRPIMDAISKWWKLAFDSQTVDSASNSPEDPFDSSRWTVYAEMIIALLYGLMMCVKAAQVDVELDINVEDLIEACILSPLFARMTVSNFSHANNCDASSFAEKNKVKWDNILMKTRGSLSNAPVGDLRAARWAQLLDKSMKYTASIAGSGNSIARSGWFDGHGVSVVLRLITIGKSPLKSVHVSSALGLQIDSIAELSSSLSTVVEMCSNGLNAHLDAMPPATNPPTTWTHSPQREADYTDLDLDGNNANGNHTDGILPVTRQFEDNNQPQCETDDANLNIDGIKLDQPMTPPTNLQRSLSDAVREIQDQCLWDDEEEDI